MQEKRRLSVRSARVVITGMGVLSSAGDGVDAYLDALHRAQSLVINVDIFRTNGIRTHLAAPIPDRELWVGEDGRHITYALRSARQALASGRLAARDMIASCGLVCGTSVGSIEELERAFRNQVIRAGRFFDFSQLGAVLADRL